MNNNPGQTDRFPSGCMVTTGIGTPGKREIIYVNQYFYDRLGYARDSLVGEPLSALLTPASLIVFDTFMLPMLKHEGKCEEILLKVQAGTQRVPVLVNAQTFPGDDAHIYWSLFSAEQRNKLDRELVRVRKEAEHANRAKSDFLSSMSHELRTPLNAILGFSQLLECDESLPPELLEDVRDILGAGNHLLSLINEILDLARIESGKLELSLEPVDVCSLLDHCIVLTKPLAEKHDISCQHQCKSHIGVFADQTRLRQVLLNLLTNAIKYNRANGCVFIHAYPSDQGQVLIEVKDTGPGISSSQQKKLFKPFDRLGAETSGIEGTGIGLSITRALVEAMGGEIGVRSEPDQGSTFWVGLPAAKAQTTPEASQDPATVDLKEAAPDTQNQPETVKSQTLLYIEDNPMNLKLVAQFLELRSGIELLTSDTPRAGIKMALQELPDMILLDINMPELDGYQVLEILRSERRLDHVPVIALTAHAMPADIERGKAAGFDEYLTKPLDVRHFLEVLDQLSHGGQRPPEP